MITLLLDDEFSVVNSFLHLLNIHELMEQCVEEREIRYLIELIAELCASSAMCSDDLKSYVNHLFM